MCGSKGGFLTKGLIDVPGVNSGSVFSSPDVPYDNSADIARAAEESRQQRIKEGQSSIDQNFSSFNDDFFNKYQQDYTGYYSPQLDDQYSDARKKLTLQLAKTGNLTSSYGIDRMGDLKELKEGKYGSITNEALNAANSLRSNIDARKSQLYQDNLNAADPGSAASAAASAATSLQPAIPNSPLANAFADFFNTSGNAASVYGRNSGRSSDFGVQNYNSSGGNSSSRVVY